MPPTPPTLSSTADAAKRAELAGRVDAAEDVGGARVLMQTRPPRSGARVRACSSVQLVCSSRVPPGPGPSSPRSRNSANSGPAASSSLSRSSASTGRVAAPRSRVTPLPSRTAGTTPATSALRGRWAPHAPSVWAPSTPRASSVPRTPPTPRPPFAPRAPLPPSVPLALPMPCAPSAAARRAVRVSLPAPAPRPAAATAPPARAAASAAAAPAPAPADPALALADPASTASRAGLDAAVASGNSFGRCAMPSNVASVAPRRSSCTWATDRPWA